jgi:hypothetical protein
MMIEDEILQALADPANDGTRINDIADQFRCGRDVGELVILLDSSNAELVSMGSWILGELRFELYDSEAILSRLRKLTDHVAPAVRFHASGALFPAMNGQDATTQTLLQKLLHDPNEGVRRAAEAAAARLGLK